MYVKDVIGKNMSQTMLLCKTKGLIVYHFYTLLGQAFYDAFFFNTPVA
jgi:hypothetical protein